MAPKTKKGVPSGSGKGKRVPLGWSGPFTVFTEAEIKKYNFLTKKTVAEPHFFDIEGMAASLATQTDGHPIREDLVLTAEFFECRKLASLFDDTYAEIVYEFYTTLARTGTTSFVCRLGGQDISVDANMMMEIAGVTAHGQKLDLELNFPEFNYDRFWEETRDKGRSKAGDRPLATAIEDDKVFYRYKFVAHVVCGRQEATKPSVLELSLLWCVKEQVRPNILALIIDIMEKNASDKQAKLGYGALIMEIAKHAGVDIHNLGFKKIKMTEVYVVERVLRSYKGKKKQKRTRDDSDDELEILGDSQRGPTEGETGLRDEVRAMLKAQKSFQTTVMDELKSIRKEQTEFRAETKKGHKSVLKILRSCMCMSRDAASSDDGGDSSGHGGDGGGNQGNRGEQARRDDDVNRDVNPDVGREDQSQGNFGGMGSEASGVGQGGVEADPGQRALTVYHRKRAPFEPWGGAGNETLDDEHNASDDIGSYGIPNFEYLRLMTEEEQSGGGYGGYAGPSRPVLYEMEESSGHYESYGCGFVSDEE